MRLDAQGRLQSQRKTQHALRLTQQKSADAQLWRMFGSPGVATALFPLGTALAVSHKNSVFSFTQREFEADLHVGGSILKPGPFEGGGVV